VDVASGKELREIIVPTHVKIEGHPAGPHVLAFSPDGKALLAGGMSEKVYVWNPATGAEVRCFADHEGGISALAVAPDSKSFAVADGGTSIRVRDLATGPDLVPLGGQRSPMWSVALSPDGLQVATASQEQTILWERTRARELLHLAPDASRVMSVAYAKNGQTLYTLHDDETLRLWDARTGRETRRLQIGKMWSRPILLSPGGDRLALLGDNRINLLDASSGATIRTFTTPDISIFGVEFSRDGRKQRSGQPALRRAPESNAGTCIAR
jgi:WD40 repeat protein